MHTDWASVTRQVKEASDIVSVVGSYLTLHASGAVFKAVCPFHNDHRPSLDVDPRRQRYRCWSCGKFGDVFTFIQAMEKVDFIQAREILARKAGISLEDTPKNSYRLKLVDVMKWAEQIHQEFLLDAPEAQQARLYLAERKISGPSLRQFGLGFAPLDANWIVEEAMRAGKDLNALVDVGLIAERKESSGFYGRFRDRVMFPIRDVRGQTVGFGGRILPSSPYASRSPKYYNSTETPLFNKSELLYGLDKARAAGTAEGYLAVVEGYTDVIMAHQMGITQVVATMGTALNAKHVHQLRRFAPKVVLVYDADEGGMTGVDRALEIFITNEIDLSIAMLPDSLDPFDLLVRDGADSFKKALSSAVDALDFKLNQLLERESVLGTQRMLDEILEILALSPDESSSAQRMKQELIVTRIGQRFGLRQETVWARFGDLKAAQKKNTPQPATTTPPPATKSGPAPPLELQLLQVLLAEPTLVGQAQDAIPLEELTHGGLRKMLEGLYTLRTRGEPADIDGLRVLIDHPALINKALEMQEIGRMTKDRVTWLNQILEGFRKRHTENEKKTLQSKLTNVSDPNEAMELLKRLQQRSKNNTLP